MKKFNLIQPYYLSFFSKELYQDVAQHWRGAAFGYLLLLLAITWLPSMYLVYTSMSHWLANEAPLLVEQMPKMTIQDGQVSIDKPSPHVIKNPNTNTAIAIFDMSDKTPSFDNTPASVFISKNQILTKNENDEVRAYSLKNIKSFTLDKEKTYSMLERAKIWLTPALYFVFLFFSWIYRVIWGLIFTAIGALIFSRMLNVQLDSKAILRIAIIAMTPAIILATLLEMMGLFFPYQGILLSLITLGYLYFGIAANKTETGSEVKRV